MLTNVTPDNSTGYFRAFSAYLRSGETGHLARVFPEADNLSAAAVYRNGFMRGCIEALRASYPVVEMLVGENYFDLLAQAYVDVHPPLRSTFIGYGDRFPVFLKNKAEQHQLEYLPDFAYLDQAWLDAYFAEDSTLLSEEDIEHWRLAGHDISGLSCCLPKSTSLLTLDYQVSTLWLKLKSGSSPNETVQIHPGSERLLVWRDAQDQVNVRVVTAAEFTFLATLSGGSTLIQAATRAINIQGDFPVLDYFTELLNTDVLAVD